jgi:hypothetical protein
MSSVTRRNFASLIGMAALSAVAPLPLISAAKALAQGAATPNFAVEPVSLPIWRSVRWGQR